MCTEIFFNCKFSDLALFIIRYTLLHYSIPRYFVLIGTIGLHFKISSRLQPSIYEMSARTDGKYANHMLLYHNFE